MGTLYAEFRTILTGMLKSYRSDGDMPFTVKHPLDRSIPEGGKVHPPMKSRMDSHANACDPPTELESKDTG
jgi:hypothetical protein